MTEWLSNLADHWWWVGAGALLGILEILLPGVFLIWVAIAAWITGLIVAFIPLSLALQLVIFVLLAFATVWLGRQYYARVPVANPDPNLNVRASRLIGQVVTVGDVSLEGTRAVRVSALESFRAGPSPRDSSHSLMLASSRSTRLTPPSGGGSGHRQPSCRNRQLG